MFTGIVEEIGRLLRARAVGGGREFCFAAPSAFLADCRTGASIAINGVCQTVSEYSAENFCVFASGETLRCTTLGRLARGDAVHLERALPASGRFDGHIVTGHVDGVARVVSIQKESSAIRLSLALPRDFLPLVAVKGSLALDGVSLTVQNIAADKVEFVIIPESIKRTSIGEWRAGREVNIELDILARYTARMYAMSAADSANTADALLREAPSRSALRVGSADGYGGDIRRED